MSGNEVREKIIECNRIISENLTPAFFTLNRQIEEARKTIEYLRTICPHDFDETGHCIYCDKEVD